MQGNRKSEEVGTVFANFHHSQPYCIIWEQKLERGYDLMVASVGLLELQSSSSRKKRHPKVQYIPISTHYYLSTIGSVETSPENTCSSKSSIVP